MKRKVTVMVNNILKILIHLESLPDIKHLFETVFHDVDKKIHYSKTNTVGI
jgi:hypothetical protein